MSDQGYDAQASRTFAESRHELATCPLPPMLADLVLLRSCWMAGGQHAGIPRRGRGVACQAQVSPTTRPASLDFHLVELASPRQTMVALKGLQPEFQGMYMLRVVWYP